jgi:hypothetical protein
METFVSIFIYALLFGLAKDPLNLLLVAGLQSRLSQISMPRRALGEVS